MSSSSSPPPHAAAPMIGRGRSMAAAMGMGQDWDRVLSYIPPSRLATPEQQQRLASMQMSMLMGVKQLQSRQPKTADTAQQRRPGRPLKEEKKEVEQEDEEDEELSDSELVDEDGDDDEIRAMKAELRQLRAEKNSSAQIATTKAAAPAPSRMATMRQQPVDSDLAALVDRLTVKPVLTASIDDPD